MSLADHPGPAGGSRDDRLAEALGGYIDRLSAGERLDPEEVRREHPELAAALIEELETFAAFGSRAPEGELAGLGTLGHYELRRQIGRGGMGVVYEAEDRSMDRLVAVKVLPHELLADSRAVARFFKEARIAGRLHHPGIVSVHGMGVDRGRPYFAMELVQGTTLARLLAEHGPAAKRGDDNDWSRALASISPFLGAPPESEGARPDAPTLPAGRPRAPREVDLLYCLRLAQLFAELAEALQHAHQNGITHRDLKPSNLIVDSQGRARILDFGLARLEGQETLTRSGDLIGTPAYMSPEQVNASNTPVDHRADIYSLGASLYEMLVLEPPFSGRNHQETLSRILSREPRPPRLVFPRIPRDLETVVLKCLEKDPAQRYRTAEALAQDLRRFARGDPIEARPQAAWERLARRAWRRKGALAAAALIVFLALAAGLFFRSHQESAARARQALHDRKLVDALLLIEYAQALRGDAVSLRLPEERARGRAALPGAADLEEGARQGLQPAAEALELLAEAARLAPGTPQAEYLQARALRLLGRDEEALESVRPLLAGGRRFAPAAAWHDAHYRSGPRAGGTPAGTSAQQDPKGGEPWFAAHLAAHRALAGRDWQAAAGAFSGLAEAWSRGEPYPGALLEARLSRGRARLELFDLDGALEDFAAAQALEPRALEPPLLLATVYHLKGRAEEAEARLRALHAAAPFPELAALRISELHDRFGDFEKALEWAERLAPGPERELARTGCLRRLGRIDDALEAAKEAERLAPADVRVLHALGWIHTVRRELEGAKRYLARVIELDPRSAMTHNNLGWALLLEGKLDEAMKAADRALELRPRLDYPHIVRAACFLRRGEPQKAIAEYEEILRKDPGSALGHHNLAIVLEQLRRFAEAEKAYREAIRSRPRDLRSLYNLANLLSNLGRHAEAVELYERALAVKPGHDWSHNNLGIAFFRLERLDDAAIHFAAAIESAPESAEAYFNLAAVHERRGDLEAAIARLAEGLPRAPRDPRPRGQLARWKEAQGDLAGAAAAKLEELRVIEEHIERFAGPEAAPPERMVLDRLGCLDDAARLLLAAGDGAAAREKAAKALAGRKERAEREGAPAAALNDYAWTLLVVEPAELQDPAAALVWAEKAAAASGGKEPGILDTLALAAFRSGDLRRAVEIEEKALALLDEAGEGHGAAELRRELEGRLEEFRRALATEPGE
jgi:serine/threonine protein kinase/Tfp pilus assembly protein PilF